MRVPLYESCIYLGTGADNAACCRTLPKRLRRCVSEALPGPDWEGCFIDTEAGDFAILLKTTGKTVDIATVFHEVEHAVSALCKYHGLVCDPDNDEASAYLQGWLGEWLMACLHKRGLRAK